MATIKSTLNYDSKTGFDVDTGSGSERWCALRRFNEAGEFESLFIARFKYMKAGTQANRYCRKLVRDLGDSLATITQAGLDEYRAGINEQERVAFMIKTYGTANPDAKPFAAPRREVTAS